MKLVGLSVILFLTGLHAAFARIPTLYDYTQVIQNRQVVSNGLFAEKAPDLGDIEKALPNIKSDVDFLDYLRTNFPVLNDNFVLVHRSESQQLSSLAHPRVIVFGGGAAFTFSEEPSQKSRKVEMLFADPKTYAISLHEIEFENNQATLNKNPKSCLACHGSPARPLWNPYDFWPNSYGSAVGTFSVREERNAYLKLVRNSAQSPLFSKLNLQPTVDFGDEPLTAFTQYIGKLNMGRWISQNLPRGSRFDQYAKPFVAAAGFCLNEVEGSNLRPVEFKNLAKFFRPNELQESASLLKQFSKDQSLARNHFKSFLDSTLQSIFPKLNYLFKIDHTRLQNESDMHATMRWIFALAGIRSEDLSSSLIANDTLISMPSDFSAEFLISLFEQRPDLFADIPFKELEIAQGKLYFLYPDCSSLSKMSLAENRQRDTDYIFRDYTDDITTRPVISRCSKCHAEHISDFYDPAPSIPFDNPSVLAQRLRAPGSDLKKRIQTRIYATDGRQMPPSHPLTDEEREALMSYLDNLN